MTKARKEAQDQLRHEMQTLVTDKLQSVNQALIAADKGPNFPRYVIEDERRKLQGMIEAYRHLGFRTDVFN